MGKIKWNIDSARKEFEKRGFELLETEYLGYTQRMRFKCPNHPNDETKIIFQILMSGGDCKKCQDEKSASKKRLNINKVRDVFIQKNCILLEDVYINNTTKMKFTCNIHDFEIQETTYANFKKNKHGCKYCANESTSSLLRRGYDSVLNLFKEKDYTLISTDYKNAHTKLEFICNKHPKTIQYANYSDAKKGNVCRDCDNEQREKSMLKRKHDFEFVKHSFEEAGYTLLEETYVDCDTKMRYICPKHGEQEITFYKLNNEGNRCNYCSIEERARNSMKTQEEFDEEVYNLVGNEYTFLERYSGATTKIKVLHNNCGNIFLIEPYDFISSKNRCKKCHSSSGERVVFEVLESYNIEFMPQYKFDDCKYKNKLPFDFAIFKDDKLLFLIEYQGQQHYKPVEIYGGEEGFIQTQIRDNIKRNYCKINSIPLLEIPYWDFNNIKEIVIDFYNKCK